VLSLLASLLDNDFHHRGSHTGALTIRVDTNLIYLRRQIFPVPEVYEASQHALHSSNDNSSFRYSFLQDWPD
jgi:hypothetical protein